MTIRTPMIETPRGCFISFEGIDGAGKSTHIEPLAQWLRERGQTVVVTREPGGTPLAEALRSMVLHDAMDTLTEALLVFAARRDHLLRVIVPALDRGAVVLCDRFTDASFAYQGAGRGLSDDMLTQLEHWVQSVPDTPGDPARATGGAASEPKAASEAQRWIKPDLTLWFDITPEQAAERLARARTPDRFEAETLGFFERVRLGYARRAQAAAGRIVRVDAAQPPELVWHQVTEAVASRWPLPSGRCK